jgi:hypothetical protein
MFEPQPFDPSRRTFVLAAAAAPMLLQACAQGPNYTGPSVVLKWNETTLSAVRSGTLAPPMVARALAIVYTSMYDAWAPYDRDSRRWAVTLRPAERLRKSSCREGKSAVLCRL